MSKIFISGFPYVRERYFETFRHYESKNDLLFLLPKTWKVKKGKVIYHAPKDSNVIPTNALFHHSDYPIIGGLLKGWMPSFPIHLWKHRHDVKLVYSCSEPILLTTLYQGFFAKFFGKKHVIFSWENIAYTDKFKGINWLIKKLILRLNLWFADAMICGNSKCVDVHRPYTNIPMEVIPMNGLDDEIFRIKDVEKNRKVTFTFVGAIDERKGVDIILKAFVKIRSSIPDAKLVIAGFGSGQDKIDRLIKELDLVDIIDRRPWVAQNELLELLSSSDVFLYPSIQTEGWQEQFGYSMAEASLMELPVISTKTGSIDEVVLDGQTGILVSPNNVEELRNAIIRLGKDQQLREQMGKAGREYIQENYNHQTIAKKYKSMFQNVLNL